MLSKALTWGVPAVALLMLALTLTPAEVWTAPTNDAVYKGFDPNLTYTNDGGGGSVSVSTTSVDIATGPNGQPAANLATTLMPNITASMDAIVVDNSGATQPLRIGAWSPWSESGEFVVFGPGPQNLITAELIGQGAPGPTLDAGTVLASTPFGHYRLGTHYTVTIVVDRSAGKIAISVTGPDGVTAAASVGRQQSPVLFSGVQISLNASATGGEGSSHAVLTNYVLTLPHQRWWASKIADPRAKAIQVVLAIAGTLLLALAIVIGFGSGLASRLAAKARSIPRPHGRFLVGIVGALVVYVVGNALLFPLGSHPFDMAYEKLYAYVARTYGPVELYSLLNTQSLAGIWSGVPYVETSFPYGAVTAYISSGIGWLDGLLLGGGAFGPTSLTVEYTIKAVNVLFGLGDAALIYAILRQIGVVRKWSFTAAGLFLFNPAVWFSMSVWGQTHVISIFLVLAAILFAERRLSMWAWLALTAALLTRPQMIVFGLVVGLIFLKKFTWRENLRAVSWTVIVTFLALLPLTLALSPSLPVDTMLNNFRIQEAGGNGSALSPVSQGGDSIWPLITYLAHGAGGLQRTFTASSDVLVGSLTYQRLAVILTLAAMLLVSLAVLRRRRPEFEAGAYIPLIALGITSFLMLITGVVATHFLLALPFLLLCRRWMNNVAYFYVIAIWTITTFVPMYGEMGAFLAAKDYPLLSPANNAITEGFIRLYSWDRFITVAVVANICAVIWLAWLTARQRSEQYISANEAAV